MYGRRPGKENIGDNGKNSASQMSELQKVLKYEQYYVENKHVKPLEQTHTIVMAHNLNILHYIYKKFVCKNLASIGYYIGGMSEAELKKQRKTDSISELSNVIRGTGYTDT